MTKIAGGCHKLQEFITNHSAFQRSQVPEYALIMSLEKEKKKKGEQKIAAKCYLSNC